MTHDACRGGAEKIILQTGLVRSHNDAIRSDVYRVFGDCPPRMTGKEYRFDALFFADPFGNGLFSGFPHVLNVLGRNKQIHGTVDGFKHVHGDNLTVLRRKPSGKFNGS